MHIDKVKQHETTIYQGRVQQESEKEWVQKNQDFFPRVSKKQKRGQEKQERNKWIFHNKTKFIYQPKDHEDMCVWKALAKETTLL